MQKFINNANTQKITVDAERRRLILKDLRLINVDSNEQERSIAVIGEVIKAVVDALLDGGYEAHFLAQNIYYEDSKKDFITDFELYAESRLFHIVEAKGSTGLAGAKRQIHEQLLKTKCHHGCITDGFTWQFVKIDADQNIKFDGEPLFLKPNLDLILDKIIDTLHPV